LILTDSTTEAGDAVVIKDAWFDTLTNIWIARDARHNGLARRMLEEARSRYPSIQYLQLPFTKAGAAWAQGGPALEPRASRD
jgi:hypothetical protein